MTLQRALAFIAVALFLSPVVVGTLGCAKPGETPAADSTTTADKIAELRAQRRRDRARLRQLEEEMARVAGDSHSSEARALKLPVERIGPAPSPATTPAPAHEVVAIADDGTEIVYVGEAAMETSVVADTNLLREGRRAPREPSRARRARSKASSVTSVTAPVLRVPQRGDSLGITARRLPKVGDVTRSAPAPRAREAKSRQRRPRPGNAGATAISEYQRHVAALKAGRHDQAILGFRRFVRRYARSDYADNAQYWLGEAYYDRKMFAEALVEFEKVEKLYPTGNKVPDARLKAAFCKLGLGDKNAAKGILHKLTVDFPGSRIAELAAEKLERIAE